jgi:catechol 1,2-dioxygenase
MSSPPEPLRSSIVETAQDVTEVVVRAMSDAPSQRLREIAESLVRHLHAFARETRLTEAELGQGVDFLNRVGQASNSAHNEGMLLADVLGVSTLVCLLNNGQKGARSDASALLGPFWRLNSPATAKGGSIVRSPTPGERLEFQGRVTGPDGAPLEGVEVDVWQASPVGLYENQDASQADMNLRGGFVTDAQGTFAFESVRPAGYPVPVAGPAGELLRAQQRSPFRPAHIHFLLHRPGFKTLVTQVFVDDGERLHNDVVFGATRHLVAELDTHADASPPWHGLAFDFVMEPGDARRPKAPIA